MCVYMHIHTQAHAYVNTQAYNHTCKHACTHNHTPTYMHMQTHIHIHIYGYKPKHTWTYTYTQPKTTSPDLDTSSNSSLASFETIGSTFAKYSWKVFLYTWCISSTCQFLYLWVLQKPTPPPPPTHIHLTGRSSGFSRLLSPIVSYLEFLFLSEQTTLGQGVLKTAISSHSQAASKIPAKPL